MNQNIYHKLEQKIEDAKEDLEIAKKFVQLIKVWNSKEAYTFITKDDTGEKVDYKLFYGISIFFDFGKFRDNLLEYFSNYLNALKYSVNSKNFVSIDSVINTDDLEYTIKLRNEIKLARQNYIDILFFLEYNEARFKQIEENVCFFIKIK